MEQNQEVNYAGFWIRIGAGLLDLLFLTPIVLVLFYLLGVDFGQLLDPNIKEKSPVADVVVYAVSIIYLTYFIAKKGQATPGKSALKLYVGNRDGSRLSASKSFLRALASMVTSATLGLGFLSVAFSKEKVSLHDWLCQTRVFRR